MNVQKLKIWSRSIVCPIESSFFINVKLGDTKNMLWWHFENIKKFVSSLLWACVCLSLCFLDENRWISLDSCKLTLIWRLEEICGATALWNIALVWQCFMFQIYHQGLDWQSSKKMHRRENWGVDTTMWWRFSVRVRRKVSSFERTK